MKPIFANSKVVGHVDGFVFKKNLKASVHFLRTPPAISLSIDSLEQAKRKGADRVSVVDVETGRKYCAFIEWIESKGVKMDRGAGEQIYLVLGHWKPNMMAAEAHMRPPQEQMPLLKAGI